MNKEVELEEMVNELSNKNVPPEIIQDIINSNDVIQDYDIVAENLTEDAILQKEKNETIRKMLDELPELEKNVLIYRFGFDGNDRHTRNEIAEKLGVTLDRVRNAEDRGLKKLKHPKYSKILRSYYREVETASTAQKK